MRSFIPLGQLPTTDFEKYWNMLRPTDNQMGMQMITCNTRPYTRGTVQAAQNYRKAPQVKSYVLWVQHTTTDYDTYCR